MLAMVAIWLAVEFLYAATQRRFLSGHVVASRRLRRLADLLFEPVAEDVVTSDEPPFRARDVAHASNGSVYRPGAAVEIEISPVATNMRPVVVEPVLRRVSFDSVVCRPELKAIVRWPTVRVGTGGCTLRENLPAIPGMYVLELTNPTGVRVALSLYVSATAACAPIAILPTFTMWGYHRTSGFYPGHSRPDLDRRLSAIGRFGLVGRVLALSTRIAAKRLFGIHVNQPSWPVHSVVRLDTYFETNHRWMKWIWDKELSRLEGVWNDDIDILIPFFALADQQRLQLRLASDLDVHRQAEWLLEASHWIFVGQESLTTKYWAHLTAFVEAGGRVTLWCPQGFGYRQVAYDEGTHSLTYVCSRGKRGFWNEVLEAAEPPWDEGAIFGFQFPSPDCANATNPHNVQYKALVVAASVGRTAGTCRVTAGTVVEFPLWGDGAWRAGLNWMGGEPFRRVAIDARVHVHMREDSEVIGLGSYRNTMVVSPTFLGALWAYGHERALVEAVFIDSVTDSQLIDGVRLVPMPSTTTAALAPERRANRSSADAAQSDRLSRFSVTAPDRQITPLGE